MSILDCSAPLCFFHLSLLPYLAASSLVSLIPLSPCMCLVSRSVLVPRRVFPIHGPHTCCQFSWLHRPPSVHVPPPHSHAHALGTASIKITPRLSDMCPLENPRRLGTTPLSIHQLRLFMWLNDFNPLHSLVPSSHLALEKVPLAPIFSFLPILPLDPLPSLSFSQSPVSPPPLSAPPRSPQEPHQSGYQSRTLQSIL